MWNWVRRSLLKVVLGGAGLASCLAGAVFTYKTHYEHPQYRYVPVDQEWRDHLQEIIEISRREVAASGPAEILVDVSGAVEKPGVYTISSGGRVQEAVLAAGGFTVEADKQFIHQDLNLANVVRDRDKIYIPFIGETGRIGAGTVSADNRVVDMNSASLTTLTSLTGIGDKRAEAIISNRPYHSIDDLVSKAGISISVFNKIIEEGYQLIY